MKTVWLMCCCLLGAPAAFADDDSATIDAQLHRFLDGVSSGDRSVHEWFWADDLVYTSSSGQRFGKAEILAPDESEGVDPPATLPSYRAEDVDIRVYGDAAVLAFRLVAETAPGKDAAPETTRYFNTGTLLKRSGAWAVVAWQATRIPGPTSE